MLGRQSINSLSHCMLTPLYVSLQKSLSINSVKGHTDSNTESQPAHVCITTHQFGENFTKNERIHMELMQSRGATRQTSQQSTGSAAGGPAGS